MTIIVGTDSFISDSDADTYMTARVHVTEWTNADSATKEAALKQATQIIDAERFVGTITDTAQALAWPRAGVTDQEGREIADDAIPPAVANATAELALALIRQDLTRDDVQRAHRVRAEWVGAVGQRHDASNKDHLPEHVRRMLAPFLTGDHASARLMHA